MAILDLSIISLFLTIALIVALISFAFVVNLNKKLTRAKNNERKFNGDIESNIAMLVTKQLTHNLNGLFESNEFNHPMDSTTNHKVIKSEVESEFDNIIRSKIDPLFLQRVTSLIYREITNTDNIIEAISSELCISSSQLNRKVKLMTGMTTSHLILETRLKKAKKQLTLTQKPIGEIAMECGFNDFAYFSRSFKKEFDMTPSAFQRIPHSVNLTREQA